LAYSIEQSCLEADLLLSALVPGDVSSVGHLASSSLSSIGRLRVFGVHRYTGVVDGERLALNYLARAADISSGCSYLLDRDCTNFGKPTFKELQ
jgi:hypothetical protein